MVAPSAEVEHVLDQVEERRLGPVDVVDERDQRSLRRQLLEELARRPVDLVERERAVAQADRRGDPRRDVVVFDQRRELGARLLRAVVGAHLGGAVGDVAQRPEGDAVAVVQAAALDDPRPATAGARHHLARQPGLAQAGVAEDRDQARRARVDRLQEDAVDGGELVLAADHRAVCAPDVAVQALGRDQPVGRHLLALALERERLDRLGLDRVAHQAIGARAEVDLVLGRRLLEPGGDIDRVAGRELLLGRRIVVGDDFAGVDAGAVREDDAVARLQIDVDALEHGLHPRRGPDRAQRVVLVRQRQAEHGHDRVADVLLDLAAVARDLGRHGREVAVLHLMERFRIENAAELGRALQVAEDDRHGAPDLARRQRRRSGNERGAAVAAEAELRRVLLVALGAVDHGPQV